MVLVNDVLAPSLAPPGIAHVPRALGARVATLVDDVGRVRARAAEAESTRADAEHALRGARARMEQLSGVVAEMHEQGIPMTDAHARLIRGLLAFGPEDEAVAPTLPGSPGDGDAHSHSHARGKGKGLGKGDVGTEFKVKGGA